MNVQIDEVMASATRGIVLLTVTASGTARATWPRRPLNEFDGDKIRTLWDLTMVAFPDEYWDGLMP